MSDPARREAQKLEAEGRLEEAVSAWRAICSGAPDDGPASAALGQALYHLGEERFLVETDLEAGFPALCESLHRWAPAWFDERGGGEKAVQQRARRALEHWGGQRRASRSNPRDLYLVVLADLADRWAPWLGRFDRRRAGVELPELRRSAASTRDAKLGLERIAAEALAGDLTAARVALAEWRRHWTRPPIGLDLDDWDRFFSLLELDDEKSPRLDHPSWREAGYCPWEAVTWAQRFDSPAAAGPWWEAGFAASTAERWRRAGVAVAAVTSWRSSGFGAEAVAPWTAVGMSAEEAGSWRRAGLAPAQASSWLEAGFTTATAVRRLQNNVWHRFTPAEAGRWRAEGFEVDHILEWIEAGVSSPEHAARARRERRPARDVAAPVDSALLARWRAAGLDRTDFAFWSELGLEPEEVPEWKTRGFGSTTAAPWIAEGLTPEAARRWAPHDLVPAVAAALERDGVPPAHRDLFLDDADRRRWSESGLDWPLAARWARRGHDPVVAAHWHRLGVDDPFLAERLGAADIDPESAAPWRASGLAATEWPTWVRNDFSPEAARAWKAAGFGQGDAHRLRAVGLTAEEATRWRRADVPSARIAAWVRGGFEPEEALAHRGAGLDDRTVASLVASGARELPRWLDAGFPADDLATWSRAGDWEPEEAHRWWRRFHRPGSAREARRRSLRPEDLPWDRLTPSTWPESPGRSPAELADDLERWFEGRWAGSFPSFAVAAPWLRQEVFDEGTQAAAWRREGFAPEEAARWVRLEYFDPGRALDARAEGRTLERLETERGADDS